MFCFCVYMWETAPQHYFITFVHPLLSPVLQLLFHCVQPAFVSWHFVLVEQYRVKFCLAEANHVKSIFQNITAKTDLYVAQWVLWRFNFTLTCFATFLSVIILKWTFELYKEYCHLHHYIDKIFLYWGKYS